MDAGANVTFANEIVEVTQDMVFGNPPLEDSVSHDGQDLSPHSVFPTYFLELTFRFDEDNTAVNYNVESAGGGGLVEDPDGDMLFHAFAFDIEELDAPYDLHFDLYHTRIKNSGDIDIEFFAPFSKDAGTAQIPPTTITTAHVPEPPMLLLMGLAIGLLARQRRSRVTV